LPINYSHAICSSSYSNAPETPATLGYDAFERIYGRALAPFAASSTRALTSVFEISETLQRQQTLITPAPCAALWSSRCHFGVTGGDREFRVPEHYPLEAAGVRVASDGSVVGRKSPRRIRSAVFSMLISRVVLTRRRL